MPETVLTTGDEAELATAEAQAAELWRQAARIGEACRDLRKRIDELRDALPVQQVQTRAGTAPRLPDRGAV